MDKACDIGIADFRKSSVILAMKLVFNNILLETRCVHCQSCRSILCVHNTIQMSNQKRQVLKDKFKGFNTELEELHKIQKDWSLPDPVLRQRVRNDNVELILPLYTTFYEM